MKRLSLCLALATLFYGCQHCIKINAQPVTPERPVLVIDNVEFRAAKLPNGGEGGLWIEDYSYPLDGVKEVKIGWSKSDFGPAEYATINFPPQVFRTGVRKVEVTAFHYNKCTLKAYDSSGALLSEAPHTDGQRVDQKLRLSGGGISKIEVIGAEIGIKDLCYCE